MDKIRLVAALLREARGKVKIKQGEMARRLGLSQATVCKIEYGERLPPRDSLDLFIQEYCLEDKEGFRRLYDLAASINFGSASRVVKSLNRDGRKGSRTVFMPAGRSRRVNPRYSLGE